MKQLTLMALALVIGSSVSAQCLSPGDQVICTVKSGKHKKQLVFQQGESTHASAVFDHEEASFFVTPNMVMFSARPVGHPEGAMLVHAISNLQSCQLVENTTDAKTHRTFTAFSGRFASVNEQGDLPILGNTYAVDCLGKQKK